MANRDLPDHHGLRIARLQRTLSVLSGLTIVGLLGIGMSLDAGWAFAGAALITAATPMIIPSIVRPVRILLRPSALKAMRKVITGDIGWDPGNC